MRYEEAVKGRLRVKLIAEEGNEEELCNRPHRCFEDIAMVYQIHGCQDQAGSCIIPITNPLVEFWNYYLGWDITEERLFEDAITATYSGSGIRIAPIGQFVGSNSKGDSPSMYIVMSGEIGGAAAMFYPGAMASFARLLHVGGYYILPSSTNEMILLPGNSEDYDAGELQKTVASINSNPLLVSPEERLTDSVYYYDNRTETFQRKAYFF